MKPQVLAMPDYIAKLIRIPLIKLGLDPTEVTDDMILCDLNYEDGRMVSIIVMCTTELGWFNRIKAVISLSFVELDDNTRAVKVLFNETMPLPTGPSDAPFLLRFSAKIRSTASLLA